MGEDTSEKTCGTCTHWHFTKETPQGRGGECRCNPPTPVAILQTSVQPVFDRQSGRATNQQQLGCTVRAVYPNLAESFPACDQHEERNEDE